MVGSEVKPRGSVLGRFFGRMLAAVAPGWALRRAQSRRQLLQLETHYDAAAMSRRTSGWSGPRGDANAVTARSLQRLRDVCRDLVRNDPRARAAKKRLGSYVVGTGIIPLISASNPRVEAEAVEVWKSWTHNVNADYDGRLWFAGIQDLVVQACAESGGALIVFEPAREIDGLSVPLRIRIVEPDHIDESRDTFAAETGNPIVKGVETDGEGRRLAYWLFPTHPEGGRVWRTESERVPASRVIHVYDVDRPGQMAGIPWMHAVITAMQDLGDFRDAQRMQAKIAACMVATVEDMSNSGTAISEQDPNDELIEHFEPGQVLYPKPGQSIKFNTPPVPQDSSFSADTVREIAVGLGIPYEAVSGDYTSATFSSIQATRQDFQLTVNQIRQNVVIPQLCAGVFSRVMELAAALRGWGEVPTATWHGPPLPSAKPEQDARTFTAEVRSGKESLASALMKRGVPDTDEHLAKVARGFDQLDALDLVLDSDPRKVTGAGIMQVEQDDE